MASMIRSMVVVLAVALTGMASVAVYAADSCEPPPSVDASGAQVRTDLQATGNRVAWGCGPLQGSVVDVELGARPTWVLPDPMSPGGAWLVALEDGSVVRVSAPADGDAVVEPEELAKLEPGEPPQVQLSADGEVVVSRALDADRWFDDPTPDTRVVEAPDGTLVALSDPTARYPHGAVGDEVEAGAISVRDPGGEVTRIEVSDTAVIEGTSPLLGDLAADVRQPQILVTVSDMYEGARLVLYGLDGQQIAASRPIGQGYRWIHQIGVGPTGPDGETEIIAVRTPHIGGIVEAYQLIDGRLKLVASQLGYSSHQLGSLNLDMALLADVDGDGRLEIIVPTQDMTSLGLLERAGDGFSLIGSPPLGGRLATNVAAVADDEGNLVLAAGTEDGRLRIYR
jgi:hypothetical protein